MGSGASKPTPEQLEGAHVVIIGCGYAGLQLASDLRTAGVKFTVIEPKEYFHHCVAALRAAVEPGRSVQSSMSSLLPPSLGTEDGHSSLRGLRVELPAGQGGQPRHGGEGGHSGGRTEDIFLPLCHLCGQSGPPPGQETNHIIYQQNT